MEENMELFNSELNQELSKVCDEMEKGQLFDSSYDDELYNHCAMVETQFNSQPLQLGRGTKRTSSEEPKIIKKITTEAEAPTSAGDSVGNGDQVECLTCKKNSNTNSASALSSSALLSTLSSLPPTGVSMNAAMAAYQSALLSAMAANTHTFPRISAPTDLSLKNTPSSTSLHATSTASSLAGSTASQSKAPLLSHKLSGAEVGAVRQLITGYRESAAFLLRSADELEALLLNQP